MKIHGKERNFLLTVGAASEIAKFCPDKDIGRIGEVFSDNYVESIDVIIKMIRILSNGYEQNKAYETDGYVPDPITEEELMALPMGDLMLLQADALAQFKADSTPEVELEEPKKETGAETAN